MYRARDAAIVRTAAHPTDLDIPPWPDLTAEGPDLAGGWRDWLAQVWTIPTFTAAVADASPELARRVRQVLDGHEQRARQVRSTVVSITRYLLRATGRATPFGLFAGIAPPASTPPPPSTTAGTTARSRGSTASGSPR